MAKVVDWQALDIINVRTNELVTDACEWLDILKEYRRRDSIFGYYIVSNYNEGDFDISESITINWDGFTA